MEEEKRMIPMNALDFNMQVIKSKWGKGDGIPASLREKLTERFQIKNPDTGELEKDAEGNVLVSETDLWGLLGSYTQDLRLGNLDKNIDIPYCEHYLNLANDLLKEDLIRPFIIALSRVATRIELSQSKNGFLRRRPNAIETKQYSSTGESKKSGLFSKKY